MPVAKVYVPENTLTPEQRREIVKGVHEVINPASAASKILSRCP